MADLSFNENEIFPYGSDVRTSIGVCGAPAIQIGEPLYENPADGRKLWPASAAQSQEAARVIGISISGAFENQKVTYITDGQLLFTGASLVAGEIYVLSETLGGKIAPDSDLTAGGYCTVIGTADSTTVLDLLIFASNVKRAA